MTGTNLKTFSVDKKKTIAIRLVWRILTICSFEIRAKLFLYGQRFDDRVDFLEKENNLSKSAVKSVYLFCDY